MDHGLPPSVYDGGVEGPLFAGEDHGVELVDCGDEGVLGVFEDFGVAAGELFEFCFFAVAGCADEAVVAAAFAGGFAIALSGGY